MYVLGCCSRTEAEHAKFTYTDQPQPGRLSWTLQLEGNKLGPVPFSVPGVLLVARYWKNRSDRRQETPKIRLIGEIRTTLPIAYDPNISRVLRLPY